MQSVYSFGREERLQSAYEITLPNEKIELRGNGYDKSKDGKNRAICSGIKRKAGSRKND
jgi:hypothetical protein